MCLGLSEAASQASRHGLRVPRTQSPTRRYFQNSLWQGMGTSANRSCLREMQMLKPLCAVLSTLEEAKKGSM